MLMLLILWFLRLRFLLLAAPSERVLVLEVVGREVARGGDVARGRNTGAFIDAIASFKHLIDLKRPCHSAKLTKTRLESQIPQKSL